MVDALSRFDCEAVKQAWQVLISLEPDHSGLPHFRVLCEFIEKGSCAHAAPNFPTLERVAALRQSVLDRVTPASVVMGDVRTAFLRKIWSDLAGYSERARISAERQDCFAAELYWRAQQASDVVRTASAILGGALSAAAQRWLALGYYASGAVELSREACMRYA